MVLDALERRALLAAVLPGNLGQVLQSQFQPFGFQTTVGTQWDGVRLGGPLGVDVVAPAAAGSAGSGPINTGLINESQFNGGGFRTIGLQFQDVRIGGGVTVHGSDNEEPGIIPGARVSAAAAGRLHNIPRTVVNKGTVDRSQLSDGGFGVLDRDAAGEVVAREGRVGLQWRQSRVRGPVDVGIDVDVVQPGGPAGTVAAAAAPGTTAIEPATNTGTIRDSQFNDGGFGDIGMQWSRVAVGGRVATSTNSLFILPTQDRTGPITIDGRTFGQAAGGPASTTVPASAPPPAVVRAAATQDSPTATTDTNSATNSGQVVGSQFDDGGFGDVGLQWKKVRVRGAVTAVHNSLTVQPEDRGQGFITVHDVQFPAAPAATSRTPRRPSRLLATDPATVSDGDPVANLPTPTGPLSPSFATPFAGPGVVTLPHPGNFPLVNAATNSGLIRGGQFNAGGFGDQGLQWLNVGVNGSVKVVHNSLSVHPEGSGLAGVVVSDVRYGKPVSKAVARDLVVIPSLVISPGSGSAATDPIVTASAALPGRLLTPPNDRSLAYQQVVTPGSTDVFLQWNGVADRRGLVVVHNIIKLTGVGPDTGPITLTNIRFPFQSPLGPLAASSQPAPTVQAQALATGPTLNNTANNSGILDHAQFSAGGFGDDALQWRQVQVGGSVEVVHNTLAVDASADDPVAGDVSGPLSVDNVTFNSGASAGSGRAGTSSASCRRPTSSGGSPPGRWTPARASRRTRTS